ncbi:hypothetical protein R3P38DRAFT_3147887 [Favolaschia claudopus]|uniref:Uncharacterized protein n=1 Tax=Favolaschia claudopus TaxID=2862362 RepID=A0AAV9Z243_9AGAR
MIPPRLLQRSCATSSSLRQLAPRHRLEGIRLGTRAYVSGAPRPPTFAATVWYRADGTPRSKTEGLFKLAEWMAHGIAFMIVYKILKEEFTKQEKVLEEENRARQNGLIAFLANIRDIDGQNYTDVDLSNYPSCFHYFSILSRAMLLREYSAKKTGEILLALERVDSMPPEQHDKAHAIMREAAETVHKILLLSEDDSDTEFDPAFLGAVTGRVLGKATVALARMLNDDRVAEWAGLSLRSRPLSDEDADKESRILG